MARKILLADDSVTAQNMGRKILTDAGYEVTTVNNGSTALKKIAEHKPDLIVLDVYMPGYSGLEVCQRLKESRETQRIPVLLTVGKLEPFKPEEARRARADAYIIKPFEASELLVALTKLEDKIVPQGESFKPGRFAKAIAAVEETQSEPSFGDSESGWKNRIRFPSATPKPSEPEPEAEEIPPAGKRGFRDFFRLEPKKSPQPADRDLPEGIPKDITPEEIAAITAAAARIGSSAQTTEGEKVAPEVADRQEEKKTEPAEVVESAHDMTVPSTAPSAGAASVEPTAKLSSEELPPATFASAPEDHPATEEGGKEQRATDPDGTIAESAVAAIGKPAPAEIKTSTEVTSDLDHPASSGMNQPAPTAVAAIASDAEVFAALQTLVPMGQGSEVAASVAAIDTNSGARWIAEPVALATEDASLILEKEMEKAYAAAAAADAGRATFAAASSGTNSGNQSAVAVISADAELAAGPASIAATVVESKAEEPISESVAESVSLATEAQAEISQAEAPAPFFSTPVAEESSASVSAASADVPLSSSVVTASENAAVDQKENVEAASLESTKPTQVESIEPAKIDSPVETPAESDKSGIAIAEPMAVASSASEAPVDGSAAETTAPQPEQISDTHSSEQDAAQAAAWASWHQIRQTIAGSTSQVVEQTASAIQEAAGEKTAETEAMAAAAAAGSSASNPDAIANIVDSVLAELKPKLVEEIARKLKK
ncbi:MAG TPA: response regulator [Terriglobales bacterium]|nr:response regulator [Terriglobales bacterium]